MQPETLPPPQGLPWVFHPGLTPAGQGHDMVSLLGQVLRGTLLVATRSWWPLSDPDPRWLWMGGPWGEGGVLQ